MRTSGHLTPARNALAALDQEGSIALYAAAVVGKDRPVTRP
jgi:hypothetical protein